MVFIAVAIIHAVEMNVNLTGLNIKYIIIIITMLIYNRACFNRINVYNVTGLSGKELYF